MAAMALTPELVALCFRQEPEIQTHDFTPIGDDGRRALAERLAGELDGSPLWLFAYGSLIWKPAFEAAEKRRGTAYGWHRSFCMELPTWRGTPEQPGLMMALERGGRCDGVVYRLVEGDRTAQLAQLLEREVHDVEGAAFVRWMTVHTAEGRVKALGFWVGVGGRGFRLQQPLEAVAPVLARACGHAGSCADYLYNTVSHLEAFGIRDRNLWRLQEMVAAEIRAIHPLVGGTRPG